MTFFLCIDSYILTSDLEGLDIFSHHCVGWQVIGLPDKQPRKQTLILKGRLENSAHLAVIVLDSRREEGVPREVATHTGREHRVKALTRRILNK